MIRGLAASEQVVEKWDRMRPQRAAEKLLVFRAKDCDPGRAMTPLDLGQAHSAHEPRAQSAPGYCKEKQKNRIAGEAEGLDPGVALR